MQKKREKKDKEEKEIEEREGQREVEKEGKDWNRENPLHHPTESHRHCCPHADADDALQALLST